ncbi:DNA adenine methylase, partial [Cronobacter sakazakii]|nr:DNA adenine methylase [Cronobacter sakazakii]
LIDTFMPSSKGRILDVFSGVGTIPFEARLLGHTAYGFDISPAAVNISRAKLEVISKNEIQEVINKLSDFIDQNKNSIDYNEHNLIRFNGSIESYFHPETFKEILCARKFFLIKGELDASESLVQSCLLHILHGNRPYALSRKSHPITPFAPTGDFIYSNLVIKLIKKVERVLQNSDDIPDTGSKVFYQDSTKSWPEEVNNL